MVWKQMSLEQVEELSTRFIVCESVSSGHDIFCGDPMPAACMSDKRALDRLTEPELGHSSAVMQSWRRI